MTSRSKLQDPLEDLAGAKVAILSRLRNVSAALSYLSPEMRADAGRAKIGTFAYLSTTQSKADNYGKSEGDTYDVSVQSV